MLPALVSSCQSAVPVHSSQTAVTVAPHATAIPGHHAQTAPAAQLTSSVPQSIVPDPSSTGESLEMNQEFQASAVTPKIIQQTQSSSSITTPPHIQQCSGSGASQPATEVCAEVRQNIRSLQKVKQAQSLIFVCDLIIEILLARPPCV